MTTADTDPRYPNTRYPLNRIYTLSIPIHTDPIRATQAITVQPTAPGAIHPDLSTTQFNPYSHNQNGPTKHRMT